MTSKEKVTELLRLTDVYRRGCSDTQTLEKIGVDANPDIPFDYLPEHKRIYSGDPTACEECTNHFAVMITKLMNNKEYLPNLPDIDPNEDTDLIGGE